MKKLLVSALVLSMTLSAGVAFAAKKGGAKKASKAEMAKKWDCDMGDKKLATATLDECMKMGGVVLNYPGPAGDAPKAKAPKGKKK